MTRKHLALLIAALMIVALVAGSVIAAPRGKVGGRRCGPRMAKALNLTPDQITQIKQIRTDARSQAEQIKQSGQTPEQTKAALKELRKNTRAQVSQVLTPEQREKAAQMKKHRRGHMFRRIIEKLDLTEDQKAQIKQIRENTKTTVADIKAQTGLSDEQKRDQIRQIRKQAKQDVLNVLTPDQKEQLKQMRAARGRRGCALETQ